ncbi:hypothetical protein CPC16_004647, partial [Podila verticillata]
MNNASSSQPNYGEMVAELVKEVRSLKAEVAAVRSLQQQSTGSTDPSLIRQNDSFAFQPSEALLQAGIYDKAVDGATKCTFLESLFLSPISADEKKAVATSSHTMLGVDYSPPPVPKGVTLQGDQKLWDSQLRDIQYHAGQTLKWLDYYMHVQAQESQIDSDSSQLSFLVAFHRNYVDFICSISQTRLNNLFKFTNILCKAPSINPALAPQLIDPTVMRDTLATAEATKKNWRPSQSETKSNFSKSNRKRNCGHKPTPTKPPVEQDEGGLQPSRPKSSAPPSDTS